MLPLTLHEDKSAQLRLMTFLAVKYARALDLQNEVEKQECFFYLEKAMELFSVTPSDLNPYVEAVYSLVADNNLSEDQRSAIFEHNCKKNKFDEWFAQFEYLHAQKHYPKQHLNFLAENYRKYKNGELAEWKEKELLSTDEEKYLPCKWYNKVCYDNPQ